MKLIKYESELFDMNNIYYLDFSNVPIQNPGYRLIGFNHTPDSVEYWDKDGEMIGYYIDFIKNKEFHI